MLNHTTIAKELQETTIALYWQMLREGERNAKTILDRHFVEAWYRHWNKITGDNLKPEWTSEPS